MFAAAMLAALPAQADDFIDGVYVASDEDCARAKTSPDALQALFENGKVVLTARGIEGIEYHCEFLQVLKGTRSPGFVALALCEEPGYAFPDTIAIMPRGEGELELTSFTAREAAEPTVNSGSYRLCEGLALP
jgi:hypothetical protein